MQQHFIKYFILHIQLQLPGGEWVKMKKYEKIKLLEKELLELHDSFQLHTADLAGWDLKIIKAQLEFEAKQKEYDQAAARKQTLLENIKEHMDLIREKLIKVKGEEKADVTKAKAAKKTAIRKKKKQVKEEKKSIEEKVIAAKKEFIEKVAKMEEAPEEDKSVEKTETPEPQELPPPPKLPPEPIMSMEDLEKELEGLTLEKELEAFTPEEKVPEDEPIHEKEAVIVEQKELSESLGEAKQTLNDNIAELENIKQAWIDEYKTETGKNAIWRGEITKGFKDFCEHVLGIKI